MPSLRNLVLGTNNLKKRQELVEILGAHDFTIRLLSDFPTAIEVVEDGDTFAANAFLKASQQARHLNEWVLAEDSGLIVDALDGAPGVYSARYAARGGGSKTGDEANNERLIRELQHTPLEKRTARYICHVILCNPAGEIQAENEAACEGRIRLEPAGSAGFGYDPYFEVVEYHKTFAELGEVVKSVLSHRGRAMRGILPRLRKLLND